jgi:hypothetical protein
MKSPEASLEALDRAGMAASVLCAIHCIALPLLLGSLTAAGIGWLRYEGVEWAILTGSAAMGLFGLLPGYKRVHRHKRCLWLFCAGLLTILTGKLASSHSLRDTPFVVCGAALIISAHAFNRHLCARCSNCTDRSAEGHTHA